VGRGDAAFSWLTIVLDAPVAIGVYCLEDVHEKVVRVFEGCARN
jgi:hypothetical protein